MSLDYRIAALVGEDFARKNTPFPVGTPVRIEYAYPASRPADWPESGFQSLETAATFRNLVEQALSLVESTCGVDFVEATAADARVAFGVSPLPQSGVAGYTLTFYHTDQPGYVSYVIYDDSLMSMANPRQTILHEIGHALGLKHPGAYNADDTGPFLPAAEDSTRNTIMSYHVDSDDALAFAPYDIAALRYLYGPPIGPGTRVGLVLDGQMRSGSDANELFALDSFDWWRHNNTTVFTSVDGNIYRASSAGLTIDGGAGTDEAYIPLARSQVRLERVDQRTVELKTEWSVNLAGGKTGQLTLTDRLIDIERLHFSDGVLALDTAAEQPAGQAYALLYAALDAPPPAMLLGQCLARFDAGLTMQQVAEELIATYAPDISAATLVELLYRNLVGAAPTQETLDNLATLIDSGAYTRGGFWAAAAGLELNRVQFVGIIDAGVTYT